MKYQLINQQTGEKTLCDKVTIDGFDYYVSDVKVTERFEGYLIDDEGFIRHGMSCGESIKSFNGKKIIACNNPNIDIPKVVDEVFNLSFEYFASRDKIDTQSMYDFKNGYNKSQETHPFSEGDAIEFSIWRTTTNTKDFHNCKDVEEQLQLWKEQRHKKVYYEK